MEIIYGFIKILFQIFKSFLLLFHTSRSAPANEASRKTQFCIFVFFKTASLKHTLLIWLPSKLAPFKLAPASKIHNLFFNKQL